jgi:hypothetical protein
VGKITSRVASAAVEEDVTAVLKRLFFELNQGDHRGNYINYPHGQMCASVVNNNLSVYYRRCLFQTMIFQFRFNHTSTKSTLHKSTNSQLFAVYRFLNLIP